MTVVNIAGTSGSGKTTIVRRVLPFGETVRAVEGRITRAVQGQGKVRQLGQIVRFGAKEIFIAGRYDVDCGGCDTIKDIPLMFDTLRAQAKERDVIFEGLFVLDHTRGVDFAKDVVVDQPLHILHLTTTFEQCKASINERRALLGKAPWTRWRNVENSVVRARNFAAKLEAVGAVVHHVGREAATRKLVELLGLKIKVPPFQVKRRTGVLF